MRDLSGFLRATVGGALISTLAACGQVAAPEVGAQAESETSTSLHQCGGVPDVVVEYAMPRYNDLANLADAADSVVIGLVERDDECVAVREGEGSDLVFPYSVARVAVIESIGGERTPDRIAVVQPRGAQSDSTELEVGESVVLFLRHETQGSKELDAVLPERWTPVGWNAGIADLATNIAHFRGGPLESVGLDTLGATVRRAKP